MPYAIDQQLVDFIAQWEGFRANPYNDPAGNATGGYGHLIHMGPVDGRASEAIWRNITEAIGKQRLAEDIKSYAAAVDTYVKAPLTYNQWRALVSFTFNVGQGNLQSSKLLAILNAGDYAGVPAQLMRWVYGSDGVQYPGLVRRRTAEGVLWNTKETANMSGEPREQYGRRFNVLPVTASQERWKEVLLATYANRETIGGSYDDAGIGALNDKTAVLWDIPADQRPVMVSWYSKHYPGTKVVFKGTGGDAETGIGNPPIHTPRGRYRIGVNGLANFHEMERAFELGCRFGMVVNDFAFASKLMDRFPDAIVMVRRTPFNLDPRAYMAQMEGINDPRLIYTGMNEGDEIGHQGAVLAERIRLSIQYWEICKSKGARHAGLTLSMGTPVIESAEDMQIIHDIAGPALEAGMLFDYHGYSPYWEHADPSNSGGWMWYEHRPREVIKRARLDPTKVRITLSEGAVDYGGGGGLLWAVKYGKMRRDQIPGFLENRRALYERPLVIDGVSYPAPELGEADFQMGRNEPEGQPGWGGYALGGYMDILPPVWSVR